MCGRFTATTVYLIESDSKKYPNVVVVPGGLAEVDTVITAKILAELVKDVLEVCVVCQTSVGCSLDEACLVCVCVNILQATVKGSSLEREAGQVSQVDGVRG